MGSIGKTLAVTVKVVTDKICIKHSGHNVYHEYLSGGKAQIINFYIRWE